MHQAIANRCNGVRNDYIRNSRMRTSILPIVDSGPSSGGPKTHLRIHERRNERKKGKRTHQSVTELTEVI